MRNLFFFILCMPVILSAQDSISYSEFRFTLVDAQGRDLTDETIESKVTDVFISDTSNKEVDYVFTKLEYSKKDSCWILSQYEPHGYNYTIDIYRKSDTINQKLLELRKMTLLLNGYDPVVRSGCQYCICNEIPFSPGMHGIDIPKKIESWLYVRKISINVKGSPVEFRDISAIQNWLFRK